MNQCVWHLSKLALRDYYAHTSISYLFHPVGHIDLDICQLQLWDRRIIRCSDQGD
jgi:hypothetical protein